MSTLVWVIGPWLALCPLTLLVLAVSVFRQWLADREAHMPLVLQLTLIFTLPFWLPLTPLIGWARGRLVRA